MFPNISVKKKVSRKGQNAVILFEKCTVINKLNNTRMEYYLFLLNYE